MEQVEPDEKGTTGQAAEIIHTGFLLAGQVQASDYLSIRDAARIIGVSARSVYGYIDAGKLSAWQIGSSLVIHRQDAQVFQRTIVGRPRTRTPKWRTPVTMNPLYLTGLPGRVRAGQEALLEQRLAEIGKGGNHLLPGTVARYLVRDTHDLEQIHMVLIYRKVVMPPEEERRAAIAALCADLADVIDWQIERYSEGLALLNT